MRGRACAHHNLPIYHNTHITTRTYPRGGRTPRGSPWRWSGRTPAAAGLRSCWRGCSPAPMPPVFVWVLCWEVRCWGSEEGRPDSPHTHLSTNRTSTRTHIKQTPTTNNAPCGRKRTGGRPHRRWPGTPRPPSAPNSRPRTAVRVQLWVLWVKIVMMMVIGGGGFLSYQSTHQQTPTNSPRNTHGLPNLDDALHVGAREKLARGVSRVDHHQAPHRDAALAGRRQRRRQVLRLSGRSG